jgi:hypothetical protein
MVQSRQLASILVGADRATCALWVSTTWREAVALSYPAGILSRCYNFADVGQRRISMHWVPRMAGCTGLVLVAHPDLLNSGA